MIEYTDLEERAAIFEFDAGYTRKESEKMAIQHEIKRITDKKRQNRHVKVGTNDENAKHE